METIFEALSSAYIMFSLIVGFYAAVIAGRNVPISGEFWGTLWMNTALAGLILLVALVMTAQGLRPRGANPDNPDEQITRSVYYLYAIYFVISLPGIFAITRGNDNRFTALIYSGVAFFNAAAQYRAVFWLISAWE
ncbi:MAG: hypothetical protein ACLFTK_03735 [Anaerolineales bacterium]